MFPTIQEVDSAPHPEEGSGRLSKQALSPAEGLEGLSPPRQPAAGQHRSC